MSAPKQYTCAHCGRKGDLTVIGGMVSGGKWHGTFNVCHPNDAHHDHPEREPFDCYRLVTVYGEDIGCRAPITESFERAFFPDGFEATT